MSLTVQDAFVVDETPEEAFGDAEQKKEAAIATGDERARALCMIKGAEALALMGRTEEAAWSATEGMTICSEMKFEEGKMAAMDAMTKVHLKRGRDAEELEEALDSGMDALKLSRKLGFKKGEAVALLTLSTVYSAMGSASQALKYGKEALSAFSELGEADSIAATYKALMSAHLVTSDTSKAVKKAKKAFEIYEKLKNKSKMGHCMHTIATVETKGGDYTKASQALQESKALFSQIGDYRGEAMCMETLMGLYLDAGMYVEAVKVGQDRIGLFQTQGDMNGQGYAMVKLGEVLLDNEDHTKALELSQAALGMFAGISNMDGLQTAKTLMDAAKQAERVEEIGIAMSKAADYMHIPATLVVDPGLNKRVNEQYSSAMRS